MSLSSLATAPSRVPSDKFQKTGDLRRRARRAKTERKPVPEPHAPEAMATPEPPLEEYYNALYGSLGPQHWWPANSPFEVIIGAILTQNTSWTNVERALANLRASQALSLHPLEKMPLRSLERQIRPSGYYRQKARKLKAFCSFLREQYQGSLKQMFATPTALLREKLLSVHGIGPETADSILLYAGNHSVFVVDAYTKRMLARHGWANEKSKYDDIRLLFERQLGADPKRFNELHALIVHTGKNYCRTREPLCDQCPLGAYRKEGLSE